VYDYVSIRKPPVIVLLGTVNVDEPGYPAQTYHVKSWKLHPKYATATVYNDIALIELDRAVKFSETIQPACLYTKSDIPELGLEITGWGVTSSSRKFIRMSSNVQILMSLAVMNLLNNTCQL
jgi:secreted trypsin-like serine protease